MRASVARSTQYLASPACVPHTRARLEQGQLWAKRSAIPHGDCVCAETSCSHSKRSPAGQAGTASPSVQISSRNADAGQKQRSPALWRGATPGTQDRSRVPDRVAPAAEIYGFSVRASVQGPLAQTAIRERTDG
jgi:hypothetical protein